MSYNMLYEGFKTAVFSHVYCLFLTFLPMVKRTFVAPEVVPELVVHSLKNEINYNYVRLVMKTYTENELSSV